MLLVAFDRDVDIVIKKRRKGGSAHLKVVYG